MQMHDEKAVGPLTVEDPSHGSDPTTLARAVVGAIAQAEDALQDSLSDMYDSMSTSVGYAFTTKPCPCCH
jgi:hypothetical protein